MRPRTLFRLATALAALAIPAPSQQLTLPQANARIQANVEAGQPPTHETLAARRDLLLQLFRAKPAQARAYALPFATRQALLTADPTNGPLLEHDLSKTGELAISVADNWVDDTSSTHYTLHTPTADLDLELPAAVPAPANHHLVTVHGLALAGVVAADTLTEASPTDAAACAPTILSRSASTTTTAAPSTCSTTGNQRIAVLIVQFPNNTPAYPAGLDQPAYWNTVLFGQNPSVDAYWREVSQGQTYATGDVYGPFQLAAQYDCTTTTALQAAALAAAAGSVDFTQYNRVVIVYPASTCSFGGLANVGCVSATTTIGHQFSVVWLPITPAYKPDFSNPQMWGGAAHELGHNLGMNHANTLDFNALALGPLDFATTNPGNVAGSGGPTGNGSNLVAVDTEFGDNFDVMGYPWIAGGPYNAVHRAKILGWIPPTDERDVTAGGQYTLVPAENAKGLRALHILRDPTSTSWLWLEFHQPTGFYENNNYTAHIGYNDTETSGAQIHYETPITPASAPYTYLLDMAPGNTTAPNNFYDGTLAPGLTWSDPYSLLTLTAGAQTSAGLGVTVSYDQPCATIALNASTIPAAGGTGSLTITAPPSCAWTVSSNALWINFPGAISGAGSATVPFAASANTTALQRNTYLTAQRQSLPLVQPGGSITLSSIAPNSGTSVMGTPTPFTLTYADALGLADVSQLNFDFTGFLTPDCQVAVVQNGASPYLYLLANGAYSNPGLPIGSAGTLTSPSCTLSGAASTWKASGNTATLTLGLTFTSAFLGAHNIFASAYGNANTVPTVPLGIWIVTSTAVIPPVAVPVATTTTLTASATSVFPGSSVTLTARVLAATGTTQPTGSVNFMDGASLLGTSTLNAAVATYTASNLTPGTHTFTAIYTGSPAAFTGSTSNPVPVAVQDFTLTTTVANATLDAGSGESIPLTLTPGSTGFPFPIALTCTGAPAQSTCTLSPSTVTPGTGPATAMLTLTTTARPISAGWLLLGLAPGLLAFRRRARRITLLTLVTVLAGCGQGNFTGGRPAVAGTPAGTYLLTITATAAATLTHTTTVTLQVN